MSAGAECAAIAFAALERHAVPWCIWRGTPRLAQAWAGTSDLDLLVDRAHAAELATALLAAGCRRARTADSEPPLEDWFAIAGPSGPLLHLHVHYRLVAGPPSHARFRLPWEQQVLAARRPLPGHGAFAAAPEHEAALLLLRMALQLRGRDRWTGRVLRRGLDKIHGDLGVLVPGGDLRPVRTLLQRWLGCDVPLPPRASAIDGAGLRRIRRRAVAALSPFASHVGPTAVLVGWGRELRAAVRLLLRATGLPAVWRRGSACGGIVVLLRGGDGARRERAAAELAAVVGGKFDVVMCGALPAARQRALRASARGMIAVVTECDRTDAASPGWPLAVEPDLVWDLERESSCLTRLL